MMWGNGFSMGWGWPIGLLVLVGVILLVIVAVRAFGAAERGGSRGNSELDSPPRERNTARQVLDERLAKGELNADEYRERLKVLGEDA
ncbi:MAG: SHOCT domain-containing protein [Cryobacterium sp.]